MNVEAIDYSCPHCGNQTAVDVAYAGKTGPCAACGKRITIPLESRTGKRTAEAAKRKSKATPVLLVALAVSCGAFIAMVVVGVVVTAVVVPSARKARAKTSMGICDQNLQDISDALQQYRDDHGRFPPAVVYDGAGIPAHSWRVLILPYLGRHAELVHQAYDFSKRWDSPENMGLVSLMPTVYACPDDTDATGGETSYLAVVGAGTVFDADKIIGEIEGGLESTLLVVESRGSAIAWTEPRDMDVSSLANGINSDAAVSVRANHGSEVHVIVADGTVQVLDDSTPFNQLVEMGAIQDAAE